MDSLESESDVLAAGQNSAFVFVNHFVALHSRTDAVLFSKEELTVVNGIPIDEAVRLIT